MGGNKGFSTHRRSLVLVYKRVIKGICRSDNSLSLSTLRTTENNISSGHLTLYVEKGVVKVYVPVNWKKC